MGGKGSGGYREGAGRKRKEEKALPFSLRLTEAEQAELKRKAAEAGVTVTEYLKTSAGLIS